MKYRDLNTGDLFVFMKPDFYAGHTNYPDDAPETGHLRVRTDKGHARLGESGMKYVSDFSGYDVCRVEAVHTLTHLCVPEPEPPPLTFADLTYGEFFRFDHSPRWCVKAADEEYDLLNADGYGTGQTYSTHEEHLVVRLVGTFADLEEA